MQLDLTNKEFRRLLDLVYIGNWILNSTRGDDRIRDYDEVESKIFSYCRSIGADNLVTVEDGEIVASRAYEEGGIHEAIMDYEDTVFFEILAEELARRDMAFEPITRENYDELAERIEDYIEEFEENGVEHITVDK